MGLTVVTDLKSGVFAAHNPIYYKMRHYDGTFTEVTKALHSDMAVLHLAGPGAPILETGQTIRVLGSVYIGTYEIIAAQGGLIEIDVDYSSDDAGNIISNSVTPLYYIETEIYKDNEYIGTLYNSQDVNGLITIDFSGVVQSLLSNNNDNPYSGFNYLDRNLSSYFKYRYRERWQGCDDDSPPPQWTIFTANIYIINAAMQIQELGGGNFFYYQIQQNYYPQTKFLTNFTRPKVFKNYPFDFSLIWGLNVAQPSIVVKRLINELNINGAVLDTHDDNLINDLGYGVHRLLMPEIADSGTTSGEVYVRAFIDDQWVTVINPLEFDIDQACDYRNPIYLCWANMRGGFDYWLFHTDHANNLEIELLSVMRRYVSDFENTGTIQDVVSRLVKPSIILGADGLTTDQVSAVSKALYSPRVQMLVNRDEWVLGLEDSPPVEPKWKTVIVKDGTFTISRAKDNRHSIEFEIELPLINIP